MTRLASALNSDDLYHHERLCDVDFVHSAGACHARRLWGILLVEAREACAGEDQHSAARVKALEWTLARKVLRWSQDFKIRVDAYPVACLMVRELLLDQCPRCEGRGFLPLSYGTEATGEGGAQCPDCHGKGKARPNKLAREKAAGRPYDAKLENWWELVIGRCLDAENTASHAMRKYTRN